MRYGGLFSSGALARFLLRSTRSVDCTHVLKCPFGVLEIVSFEKKVLQKH